jgi:hypothetical protein
MKANQREAFRPGPLERVLKPALYQGTTLQVAENSSGFMPGIYPRHKANGISGGFSH